MSSQTRQDDFLNDKDYYVVEFPDEVDNGVTAMAIVPYTWLITDKNNMVRCMWPTNIGSDKALTRAIVNKECVQQENSKICDVSIKYKTNDYEKAVSRLKHLECQSSLSSVPSDEEGNNRRRVKKNSKYTEFSEEGATKKNNISSKARMRQPLQSFDSSEDEPYIPSVPSIGQHSVSITSKKFLQSMKNGSTTSTFKDSTPTRVPSVSLDENVTLVNEPEPVYTFEKMFRALKRVETLVGMTHTKIAILSSDIKHLTRLQQFHENINEENEIVKAFPISTKETLLGLEESLKEENNFSEICTSLSMLGGKDCTETVRKIMAKIMAHEMALSYNWSGRNNKNEFKNLKLVNKLILGVTRKNPYCRNATQQDVEAITKQWLRSAPDRQGGRERRRTKFTAVEVENTVEND